MYNNKNKIDHDTKKDYYYLQQNNNHNIIDINNENNQNEELPVSTKIQEKKTELKVKISMMKRNLIEFKREIEKS